MYNPNGPDDWDLDIHWDDKIGQGANGVVSVLSIQVQQHCNNIFLVRMYVVYQVYIATLKSYPNIRFAAKEITLTTHFDPMLLRREITIMGYLNQLE